MRPVTECHPPVGKTAADLPLYLPPPHLSLLPVTGRAVRGRALSVPAGLIESAYSRLKGRRPVKCPHCPDNPAFTSDHYFCAKKRAALIADQAGAVTSSEITPAERLLVGLPPSLNGRGNGHQPQPSSALDRLLLALENAEGEAWARYAGSERGE